jgi:hypothetical protein
VSSLLAVFVLLSFLAITMRILVAVFPEALHELGESDAALLAALTTAVTSRYPGMRVTKVEEKK